MHELVWKCVYVYVFDGWHIINLDLLSFQVCKVQCTGEIAMEMHLAGKQHLKVILLFILPAC